MVILASCLFAVAQDNTNKAEVFGGYQYTNIDDLGSGIGRQSFNGWNAAVSGYFNNNFGITADFSGAYKSISGVDTKVYTYMFGPTLRVPMDRATPFVHALFGGGHASFTETGFGSATSNGFSYAFGGGLDVNASSNFAIRIGQFDYLGTRFEGTNFKNFRYSAGVVLKF
jgi:opacity protein-like surface antigen